MQANKTFLYFYNYPLSADSLKYYDSLTKLMDYVSQTPFNESVIYIINSEEIFYKIYDSDFRCIFVCFASRPDMLLNAVLNLMPKKLIFLNRIGGKISNALSLLFKCIQY